MIATLRRLAWVMNNVFRERSRVSYTFCIAKARVMQKGRRMAAPRVVIEPEIGYLAGGAMVLPCAMALGAAIAP